VLDRVDARLGSVSPRTLTMVLFLVCVAVYASNGKTINAGDSVPARLIPVTLLLDGTPMLDRFAGVLEVGSPRAYFVRKTPYGIASFYPIATGLLATPIVAPAVLWIEWRDAPDPATWLVRTRALEKVAATVLTALAVVVFHRLCLDVGATPSLALLLTLTFAFGSQAFSTSAQALWQHGPSCLAIVAALWCLVRAERRPRPASVAAFSALCALAVAIRPNDLMIVAPLALVALVRHPRAWAAIVLPALAGAVLLLAYNRLLFATWSGGYGNAAAMTFDFARSLPGLLLSPGRGLFVYFPASVLLLVLLVIEPRAFATPLALACLAGVLGTLLLTGAWPSWWGGHSYGPRLLTETQPLILLLLALGAGAAPAARARAVTTALGLLLPVQIGIQALGTYGPPGRPPAGLAWNTTPVPVDVVPERNWDLVDSPIARGLRGYD